MRLSRATTSRCLMRPLGKVGVEERHYWVGDTPSGPYSRPYQLITPSPHQHPIVCQGRTGGQSVGEGKRQRTGAVGTLGHLLPG